jgi:hypothetical protein
MATSKRRSRTLEAFGVDATPHLALVSAKGDVETALIGPTLKHVLEGDLNALIRNATADQPNGYELPYAILDVFAKKPEQRCLHFYDRVYEVDFNIQ